MYSTHRHNKQLRRQAPSRDGVNARRPRRIRYRQIGCPSRSLRDRFRAARAQRDMGGMRANRGLPVPTTLTLLTRSVFHMERRLPNLDSAFTHFQA